MLTLLTPTAAALARLPPSPPQLVCRPSTGTPYAITPFVDLYTQPSVATPTGTVCRQNEPVGKAHCMKAFQLTAKAFQSTGLLRAIPGCKNKAATWFL